MFRGSRTAGGKDYQAWFEDVGGETNASTKWREHYQDVPLGNLTSFAHEALYGIDDPYGTTTIGRAEELGDGLAHDGLSRCVTIGALCIDGRAYASGLEKTIFV